MLLHALLQAAAFFALAAHNKRVAEMREWSDGMRSQTEEMLGVLQDENKSTLQKVEAYKKLQELYPNELKNLSLQKFLLMDMVEVNKMLSKSIDDRTMAQQRATVNSIEEEMAKITNFNKEKGTLAEVIKGADIFIGVSAPGTLTQDMVRTMAKDPIIFACANPVPEIFPDEAKAAGAAVVSTGRSDYPNQVNNVLCFPGLFRGVLDARASDVNDEMKVAAAYAIAGLVSDEELTAEYILPAAFDPRVKDAVAKAVAEAARKSGVARI